MCEFTFIRSHFARIRLLAEITCDYIQKRPRIMLKRLTVFRWRIRKIIAPRSLILDLCNDARPPGSSFAGMIFCLSARSIPTGAARRGDHSRLPLPRSLRRVTPRRNPTRHAHRNPNALRRIAIISRNGDGGGGSDTRSRFHRKYPPQ